MKKYFFGDRIGTEIDLYALEITLLIMGFLLFYFPNYIISEEVTFYVQQITFAFSVGILWLIGVRLEKKEIIGLRQIAMGLGYIFMYILFPSLPKGGWGALSFLVIAFSVFNVVGGAIALAYSFMQQKQKSEDEKLISTIESVVVIITSIISVLLSGLQILSK